MCLKKKRANIKKVFFFFKYLTNKSEFNDPNKEFINMVFENKLLNPK